MNRREFVKHAAVASAAAALPASVQASG
ncbi:MAG: twin-arginine translocation signal domain-containing protein, partial [Acidobacteriota bacterium]